MPVKIRQSWKCQIAWTKICHTNFLPDKFYKTHLTFKVSAGSRRVLANSKLAYTELQPRTKLLKQF